MGGSRQDGACETMPEEPLGQGIQSVAGVRSTNSSGLKFQVARHVDWLLEGPVRTVDGMVAAWVDKAGPSFAYQESTGYLLSLLCFLYQITSQERFKMEAGRTARALAIHVGDRKGCGKNGGIYLFDTAICLRALETFSSQFPDLKADDSLDIVRDLAKRFAQTACRMFGDRRAVWGNGDRPGRWSAAFGPHLIKAVHHAFPWLESALGAGPSWAIVDDLLDSMMDKKSLSEGPKEAVYNHAYCYAAEGLLGLNALSGGSRGAWVSRMAETLAHRQAPDGSLSRWWPSGSAGKGSGEVASDATAQAVRIWQCVSQARFRRNIDAGLEFLNRLVLPDGGVRYASGSSHVNSWATMFYVQALIWRETKADPRWII